MKIRCVVACHGGDGPEFVGLVVRCSKEEYDNGDHYDMAADMCRGDRPYVVFDENDGPYVSLDENSEPVWLFQYLFKKKG